MRTWQLISNGFLRAVALVRTAIAAIGWGVLFALATPSAIYAVSDVAITEINPDQSTRDPVDADAASGGRTNGLATVRGDADVLYAATEWGGLYKSTDRGRKWFRLNRHLPVATWDVEVDPIETQRVYATSFYDGRVDSLAGINVSLDGGNTWTHPTTAAPPRELCSAARRDEPSAFGISIDADSPRNVYVGTNCGLAISNDNGVTWRYVDPTPEDAASDVWDVVVHHRGTIDVCGDDGHLRSTDGGATWNPGTWLPMGRCSIAASPDEPDVLFATAAQDLYETDDGGGTWTNLGTPDSRRQGRIEFVSVNDRSGNAFDVWYGDVRLYRAGCQSNPAGGGLRCPMARTGPAASPPPAGWNGPYTRSAGGHDDVGDIAFNSAVRQDGCPVIFSSDGGVYYNTLSDDPSCHVPAWEQPDVTPHALWVYGMDGADQAGLLAEDLYFGNQDNGPFATNNAGAPVPTWNNVDCCDSFDIAADPVRVVYTMCCGFSILVAGPGMTGPVAIANNPPGGVPAFNFPDFIRRIGANQYVAVTSAGAFVTNNITATPVVWTQLGAASTPAGGFCSVQTAFAGGTPTFYAQTRCVTSTNSIFEFPGTSGQLWRYTGLAPGGVWQRVDNNDGLSGGFGVFGVDPNDPDRLYASNLDPAGARMVFSTDGGTHWAVDSELDDLMTGNGAFRYETARGPTPGPVFNVGYVQPTLVAFDPEDPDIIVAGGRDSGVFVSDNGGSSWARVSDPVDSGSSGIPNIPRPWFAYFDHETGDPQTVNLYLGTQGRGVWRVNFRKFQPRFEYAAKIVCGTQKDPKGLRLARGLYATAINIHNPNGGKVQFDKKLALTFPPKEQKPGEISPIARDTLAYDEALAIDCEDLLTEVYPDGFPESHIKGFVVIQSTKQLDVTAVYSTAGLDREGVATTHSSIDVERVAARDIGVNLDVEKSALLFKFPLADRLTINAILYTIKIGNSGPYDASDVHVTDQLALQTTNAVGQILTLAAPIDLPPGGQILNIVNGPSAASSELQLGDLAAGNTVTARIWVLVPVYQTGSPAMARLQNKATVDSQEVEITPLDNAALIETQLLP